jgi:hypothetical protein
VVESKDAETPLKRVASGALLGAVVLDNPLRDVENDSMSRMK